MSKSKIDLSTLTTEQQNSNTTNIGNCSSIEIVKLINNEDAFIHVAVSKKLEAIAKAIDLCTKSIQNGGKVVYIGAGTSGRLGVLDASEILPTFGVKNKFIGIIAGGENALISPLENVEDNQKMVIEDLKKINFNSLDVLVGITASGRTPYVVSGLEYAKSIHSKTISISNSSNSLVSKITNVPIEIIVGPEAITGSTRMKSGTAQKMVLNMISSGTMIRLGKVYGNFMIDVQPSNEKLVQRCKKIIKQITHETNELIDKTFQITNSVPLAIIMIKKHCDLKTAKAIYLSNNFKWDNIMNPNVVS